MASIKHSPDSPRPPEPVDDPESGVRLIDVSHVDAWLHEPEPCSSCGLRWGTRHLPDPSGPVYCRNCVPDSPLDDFESLYRDIGGQG